MAGNQQAFAEVIEVVYPELRMIAHRHMSKERPGHLLQTTALINETYLRLLKLRRMSWEDRAHFRAVSARLMRRILVEMSRTRADKQDVQHVPLPPELAAEPTVNADVLMIDEALNRLAAFDERKAQVAEMKYFGEMTAEETAAVLGVSVQTVNRDRSLAKAWLLRELSVRQR